jgi:hypothetical protein
MDGQMELRYKPPDTREADLVPEILAYLKLLGFRCWRCNSGKVRVGRHWVRLAPEGTPDIIGFDRSGVFIGIECKRERGRTSVRDEQAEFVQAVIAAGGFGMVARSVQDVADAVEARRRGKE